tara:strand:- start:4 stop:192 length:189 start_codon:yes stop_codon:yes gene_type:complete
MKKDTKLWAIKIKKRNFYQSTDGNPFLYKTRTAASSVAMRIENWEAIHAEPVRVRVRIEEII